MSVITASGLGKYYGAQDVFQNLDLSIAHGDKIGLVGPNGAGKTTLVRIIMGLEEPTAGVVARARGVRFGYLPQRPDFASEHSVYDEMLQVFAELRTQQTALLEVAQRMSSASDPSDAMQRYAEAEARFEHAGGYTYENRIQRVLGGLGFTRDMYPWPIAVLSGGQLTRALLAKLLLQEPDLLILDEPTNYLDLAALEWLESFLQELPHSLLVVSHDRYFLDKVTTRIWELNHQSLEQYRGNYHSYVEQRRDRLARRLKEYEEQQQQIAETEDFVRRYKAGQRSKQARGRQTILDRLERVEAPQENRRMHLRMLATIRSGDKVLMSDGVTVGYGQKPDADGQASAEQHVLFRAGELLIERGQRVALLGPNGSGKSTFVRTVMGELAPLSGHIRIGASVRIGYLPQTQDWLDPQKTVLEQALDQSKMTIEEGRHLLGRFLFSGDEVYKPVSTLSGGERSRLGLALLTLRGANLLLLDEPTTHLDLQAQEVLQSVLQHFNGTIVFVSHDRYLVDALATHVWSLQDGELRAYEGNYAAYLAAQEHERQAQLGEATPPPAQQRQERHRQARAQQRDARRRAERTDALEDAIAALEDQLRELTVAIDSASAAQDGGRVHELGVEYSRAEQDLGRRLAEWEQLMSASEEE